MDSNRHVFEQRKVVEARLGTSAGFKYRLEDAYKHENSAKYSFWMIGSPAKRCVWWTFRVCTVMIWTSAISLPASIILYNQQSIQINQTKIKLPE